LSEQPELAAKGVWQVLDKLARSFSHLSVFPANR
jgi:hypothetical protein